LDRRGRDVPRGGLPGRARKIKAFPELLGLLDLEGNTVSIDAMQCPKAVAQKIYLAHSHYLLALKEIKACCTYA